MVGMKWFKKMQGGLCLICVYDYPCRAEKDRESSAAEVMDLRSGLDFATTEKVRRRRITVVCTLSGPIDSHGKGIEVLR